MGPYRLRKRPKACGNRWLFVFRYARLLSSQMLTLRRRNRNVSFKDRTECILTMKHVGLFFTTGYPRSQPLIVSGGVYLLNCHHITAYQHTAIKSEIYILHSCIHLKYTGCLENKTLDPWFCRPKYHFLDELGYVNVIYSNSKGLDSQY